MTKLCIVLLLILSGCQSQQPKTLKVEPIHNQFMGHLVSKYHQNITVDENHCSLEYENGSSIKKDSQPVRCDATWLSDDYKQKARFDGHIFVDENIIILSDEKKLLVNLNEADLKRIDKNIEYTINTDMDEIIGKAHFETINFKEEQKYVITFKHNIPQDKIIYENMSVFITAPKPYFIVPRDYVFKKGNELFVKTEDKEVVVEGKLFDEYYIIDKGITDSITLLEYTE